MERNETLEAWFEPVIRNYTFGTDTTNKKSYEIGR